MPNKQSVTAGLTTTDYPSWLTQALTGSTVKGSANPIGGYGFTQDQIKQMQDRGITVGDLQTLGLGASPQMVGATQPGGGVPNVSLSSLGQNQMQNATMLKLILGQQQQQQAAPQFQQPQLKPNPTIQLPPTAPLPVQPTAPVSTQPIFQPAAQQAPPQAPTSNVLNPIPVQLAPVQQYGSGGLVQRYQSGGMVGGAQGGDQIQQLGPGVTRNAQGQIVYTDPRLQTQLGLGDLSTAQQTALGLDPSHAQALYGATQVGAEYQPEFLAGAVLGMPAIINLPPSGTPSSKSGVAPTPGAIVGTSVPQTPQGPWLTNPSVFARATPYKPTPAPTVTPQTPATAVAYAPGQPFATPPAAPTALPSALPSAMAQSGATTERPPTAMLPPGFMGGAQGAGYVPQAFLQAHTSALADAGRALYAHAGGDPNSASPADIANFHRQLTDAVGQHIAANQPAAGVKQAATGGLVPGQGRLVPGRGNKDTVPALLTPGEYVIPKDQVAQLAARGVLKLASGGLVQDPDPDPPEARRQALTVQAGSAPATNQPSSAQRSSLQGGNLISGLSQAAQTYGNSMGGGIGGGRMGGGVDLRNTPADPDPDLPYLKAAGMGGGGGLGSAGAQSALGGVASGLNQAAQAIASSAQPWQMQQSAIPDPSQLPKYQTPTLQAQRVT